MSAPMHDPALQLDIERALALLKKHNIAPLIAHDRAYTQSRGDKIQRYSGPSLIKTYGGVTDALRDPDVPGMSRPTLMAAIKNRALYKGFRWAALARDLDDGTVQDIGETIDARTLHNGLVAMLNLDKTRIVQVFCDQKATARCIERGVIGDGTSPMEDRKFSGCAAISAAIKRGTRSGGHHFMMYDDCSPELQREYLSRAELPEKRVRANGQKVDQLHPETREVVKTYACVEDVIKVVRISRLSLKTAIDKNSAVKGYMWRFSEVEGPSSG